MESEIINAMDLIGKNTINRLDDDIKAYIMLSPYIQGISNNAGQITIHSDEYGDYTFMSALKRFEENPVATDLIRKYITNTMCHQMSWELMKYVDDATLVTSLLPSYFEGNYYHTYIEEKEGRVIDIANNIAYPQELTDYLFKAHVVLKTMKTDMDKKLEMAIREEDEKSKQIDFPKAMLLVLHEESKGLRS